MADDRTQDSDDLEEQATLMMQRPPGGLGQLAKPAAPEVDGTMVLDGHGLAGMAGVAAKAKAVASVPAPANAPEPAMASDGTMVLDASLGGAGMGLAASAPAPAPRDASDSPAKEAPPATPLRGGTMVATPRMRPPPAADPSGRPTAAAGRTTVMVGGGLPGGIALWVVLGVLAAGAGVIVGLTL